MHRILKVVYEQYETQPTKYCIQKSFAVFGYHLWWYTIEEVWNSEETAHRIMDAVCRCNFYEYVEWVKENLV